MLLSRSSRVALVATLLLSTSAHADKREAHVYVDMGGGGGIVGNSRTPVGSVGFAPSVFGGAGLRYGLANQFAISAGFDVEAMLGATSPGAFVSVDGAGGAREFSGTLQADIFVGTVPFRAEYSLDLPIAVLDFAVVDVYFAGSVGPSVAYVVNNRLLNADDLTLALVGPGVIPSDLVFGGQAGLGAGGRLRAFDFASADVELRLRAGFVGALKLSALVVVRPTFTFFPFAIF